jgi:(p)ppGpp synthase/HD superfamily hydrolase
MHQISYMTDRYCDAMRYAIEAHGDQLRKGTAIPYVQHPIAVSALVIENSGTEDQAIAALLHDVVEDCGPAHADEIGRRFGHEVLSMVMDLTDGVADERGEKPEWSARKGEYLAKLGGKPDRVILVSAADKLHNALAIAADHEEIGEDVFKRFKPERSQVLWYYRSLIDVFQERLGQDHRLVRQLRAAVDAWA